MENRVKECQGDPFADRTLELPRFDGRVGAYTNGPQI